MQILTTKFQELFGQSDGLKAYFCPGRVNLIGEHIDYLGGQVLPTAISVGITAVCRPNESTELKIHSTDFNQTTSINLKELPISKQNHWTDFLLGVVLHHLNQGVSIEGSDILISSTLPKASGLSSSAALEVLAYYMFYHLATGKEPDRVQMALDCQKIENEFIGVNCGIMDQFAVANGKKDHAILLNCNSLENKLVPLRLDDHSLLIINSNKPRTLSESAYNQRRQECADALEIISQTRRIEHLVNTTESELDLISDPILKKRTKHAFSEQLRVLASELVLQNNDLKSFGKLMSQSHESLRDDFEVSCTELDFLVDTLLQDNACLGARLTGAGFGGCCIALVKKSSIDELTQRISIAYQNQFGYSPDFYECQPSDGVHQLAL